MVAHDRLPRVQRSSSRLVSRRRFLTETLLIVAIVFEAIITEFLRIKLLLATVIFTDARKPLSALLKLLDLFLLESALLW
jgi:hypothetical protein